MRNCVQCVCVILVCDVCQWILCGVACIIGGSGLTMGLTHRGSGPCPRTPNASFWLLAYPSIPGSGDGGLWSRCCSYKSLDRAGWAVVHFCISGMVTGSPTKLICFLLTLKIVPYLQRGPAASRPHRRSTFLMFCRIFYVCLLS